MLILLANFFSNHVRSTYIYTLSLHDALPISCGTRRCCAGSPGPRRACSRWRSPCGGRSRRAHGERQRLHARRRSEEHTSELQSPDHLVCRLLLEKKKKNNTTYIIS